MGPPTSEWSDPRLPFRCPWSVGCRQMSTIPPVFDNRGAFWLCEAHAASALVQLAEALGVALPPAPVGGDDVPVTTTSVPETHSDA